MERKYRLKNSYFNLSRKKIELDIPVTDNTLTYQDSKNISSTEINAILIWIKGENGICTPNTTPTGNIIEEITFEYLNLTVAQLRGYPLLAVIVFNNDSLKESDIKYFRDIIGSSKDIVDAITNVRKDTLCNTDFTPFVHIEQDGDVSGG